MPSERKSFLLRLEPKLHAALEKWAADDLRSLNAQIEFLLRQALKEADRVRSTRPLDWRRRALAVIRAAGARFAPVEAGGRRSERL